jgi:hypothetical protein
MDFGKAFTYEFEDTDWIKKIVIMALISIIPIIGQIVLAGWMYDIIKKMIDHEPVTLPEIDFGGQLSRGFKAVVVYIVYALPIILISIIQGIVSGVAGGMAGGDSSSLATAGTAVVGILSFCFGLVNFVYGIFLAFVLPIATGKLVETGIIAEALKFGEVFSMTKKNLSPLLMVFLGSIVASIISPLGAIACGIGVFLTMVYSSAIMAHLYGQAYNIAKSQP